MTTRHSIFYWPGSTKDNYAPDNYGPALTRGWYVSDTMRPGIVNGPHSSREKARAALYGMRMKADY